MESRYGIGVNNRYALFLDSDNEDGDTMEEIMLKKTQISSADNQTKKASKDPQAKVNGAQTKKDTSKAVNNDSNKANSRDGKLSIKVFLL